MINKYYEEASKSNSTYNIIIMPRGSGKMYFIKRCVLIPRLIKAIKIKEDDMNER